jgi:CDP-diacylglycerol---glycerol-3-phosphate 3-phosphatidyltransferase
MWFNLPNRLTMLRLVVALCLFGILIAAAYHPPSHKKVWFCIGAALFGLGALTDILDGYFARKWRLVSGFGRVADPFVDKVLICGTLILLIPVTPLIPAWFVVLVVVREMAITALRSQLEGKGLAFGAGPWGKAKMLSQSILVPAVLLCEAFRPDVPAEVLSAVSLLVIVTLVLTVASGLVYLRHAPLDFS